MLSYISIDVNGNQSVNMNTCHLYGKFKISWLIHIVYIVAFLISKKDN